jgi:hypothetical protein
LTVAANLTAPYKLTYRVPLLGVVSLSFSVTALDYGGNTAASSLLLGAPSRGLNFVDNTRERV